MGLVVGRLRINVHAWRAGQGPTVANEHALKVMLGQMSPQQITLRINFLNAQTWVSAIERRVCVSAGMDSRVLRVIS